MFVALVLAVSLLSAPADAAEKKRWTPPTGGFFNNPWGNQEAKFRIERQIVGAIRHAHKGSHIRIAVYSFDRVNVAKALIEAHKRGVHVQVLHNDHTYTKAMKMLKQRSAPTAARRAGTTPARPAAAASRACCTTRSTCSSTPAAPATS